MSTRRRVGELRDKVEKYRAMARLITDAETAKRIMELADELERQSSDIERGK
jgi:hypothetical protein